MLLRLAGLGGKRGRRRGGPLGRVMDVTSVLRLLREMRVDDVRDQAEDRPVLLVLGPDAESAVSVARTLTGSGQDRGLATRAYAEHLGDLSRYDAAVVYDPGSIGRTEDLRGQADRQGAEMPIVRFGAARPDDESAATAVRERLVTDLPERAVALGRAYPPFRAAATRATINDVARGNAQFALVSNIPAVVPLVGGALAAGADTIVLTKNQLLLFLKVAAIHGRDLGDTRGIITELLPVVGAGLLWRTIAREAASFIPLAAGTIPKVVIAYAGTVSAGRAADYYYRVGHKPTRDQLRAFYEQAAQETPALSPSTPSTSPAPPLPAGGPMAAPAAAGDGRTEESAAGTAV